MAAIAKRAAQNWNVWGAYAARKYALNRGVSLGELRLARQLQAVSACQL